MKLVEVMWIDSYVPAGGGHWMDVDDVVACMESEEAPMACTTAGVLVHEDDEWIAVASAAHDDRCSGVIVIPKVAITKRRNLR